MLEDQERPPMRSRASMSSTLSPVVMFEVSSSVYVQLTGGVAYLRDRHLEML